jgi:YHS domain-containing protein
MIRIKIDGRLARKWLAAAALVLLATLAGQVTSARAGSEVNTGYFGKVAIMGYDTVAYFAMSDAVKGSEDHAFDWLGATWLFANENHRQTFMANPIKYAPQYGGLCALGVAYGEVTRNIDPKAWSIIKGKLYLNFDKGASADFGEDSANLITRADAKWPKVKARLAQ